MMNYDADSLRDFNWHGHTVRCLIIAGEPWFVACDVTQLLGYRNGRDAVSQHVPAGQANTVAIHDGIPGNPNRTIISEAGLYRLIMRSNVEGALDFQTWVTEQVLPSIRRTGSYSIPQMASSMVPDLDTREGKLALIELLRTETIARYEAQELAERQHLELMEARPKVEGFIDLMESEGLLLIRDVAKILSARNAQGRLLGSQKIYDVLRDYGVLYRHGRPRALQPYLDKGYFRARARTYTTSDGNPKMAAAPTTYVTPSGVDFIRKLLISKGYQLPRMTSVETIDLTRHENVTEI